ncbi:MAG: HisA/HisF-related TIM barrel protein [Thermoanaerobaculia bacterium]
MELIPAIDLRRGRVVRLIAGDDRRVTVYGDDPAALLERFRAAGARRVHVVDLDAALGEAPQTELVARLAGAARGRLALQVGGGLRDEGAIAAALAAGAERAVVGTLAVRHPEEVRRLAERWPGRLVPALDARDGEVRVDGWRRGTGIAATEVAAALAGAPFATLLVTDVARDGGLAGANLELTLAVARAAGIPALLSGGVASLRDLEAAAAFPEIAGAIVGRALYERRIDLAAVVATLADGAAAAR